MSPRLQAYRALHELVVAHVSDDDATIAIMRAAYDVEDAVREEENESTRFALREMAALASMPWRAS